jgi:hypothetical protein
MKKLQEVEAAKALMKEAIEWSVFKWLWEKSKVREVADDANAALDSLNRRTKKQWGDELREAYRQLGAEASHGKNGRNQHGDGSVLNLDPEVLRLLRQVKESDDNAHSARADAEATFDDAEKQLNTNLAREGCKKAIHSWNLHEKAIRAAEALIDPVRQ